MTPLTALVEALRPFVRHLDERDAQYRKRGGNPDAFPDTAPFSEIQFGTFTKGDFRRARAALSAFEAEPQGWLEQFATALAEECNGGKFADPMFYAPEQREFWRAAVRTAWSRVGQPLHLPPEI